MAKRRTRKALATGTSSEKGKRIGRPYPRFTLQEALKIPTSLKEKNGANPWPPQQIAEAVGQSLKTNNFFYLAVASREYGLTNGGRDSKLIELAPLGRDIVYAPDPEAETRLKREAFLKVEKFRQVLEYYKGNQLPEMKYLRNTLESQFGLAPDTHEEFSKVFRQNCDYLGIGAGFSARSQAAQPSQSGSSDSESSQARETVTLAEPDTDTGLTAFVIMPFRERDKQHSGGFFSEVLQSLIAPAGRQAGFKVTTANRQGSDVIQSTIVNDLLRADLVIADLTEHNPNVLFELGLRMAFDKPVALIRAKGTEPIFDVDNMLRVYDYDPNLWASSIERDLPKLMQHLKATWDGKDSESTYMKILHHEPAKQAAATASASSED
jgi:hypothetical protein